MHSVEAAHATLGVTPTTPIAEVRQRYRARAQMLHPDKYPSGSALYLEAQTAMRELNVAWELVQQADHDGSRRAPTPGATREGPRWREPGPGECDLCGCVPAADLALRQVTGLVLFWRTRKMALSACRNCSINLFREVQAATLTRGWWGLIAPIANLGAVVANVLARRRVAAMESPTGRDPSIESPFPPGPVVAPPVFRRAQPWGAVAAVVLIVGGAVNGSAESSQSPDNPRSDPPSIAGSCLDVDLFQVSCTDTEAVWRVRAEVTTPQECLAYEQVFKASDGRMGCGVPVIR
jgi:hypothetical protein